MQPRLAIQGRMLFAVCATSIASAALLVNTNKIILESKIVSGSSAGLTFLHSFSLCVAAVLRMRWLDKSSMLAAQVPRSRVLLISVQSTLGVACSNMVLQLSSVSFHQVSRLFTLPGGLLLDYILYKKVRTFAEIYAIMIVALGVLDISVMDRTASALSAFFALISVATVLVTAAAIKKTCSDYGVSATDYAFLAAPWQLLASCFLWLIAVASTTLHESDEPKGTGLKLGAFSLLLIFNCALAILVNLSSTWCAASCSTLLYGAIGQGKTLGTVFL